MLFPLLFAALAAGQTPPTVSFNRDVRPILSDRCFACHGPDAGHRKAGLRLDVREAALSVITPGQPEKSELIDRITRKHGEDGHMPPRKSGKVLTASEIALLRTWIAQGAAYERHWTLAPPRTPPVPDVKDARWGHHPVDRFILVRIEAARQKPSDDADRVTLVRRVTLDLTGLPP